MRFDGLANLVLVLLVKRPELLASDCLAHLLNGLLRGSFAVLRMVDALVELDAPTASCAQVVAVWHKAVVGVDQLGLHIETVGSVGHKQNLKLKIFPAMRVDGSVDVGDVLLPWSAVLLETGLCVLGNADVPHAIQLVGDGVHGANLTGPVFD